jgi:thiamine-phosphate pyrophosphorylase
VTPRSFRRLPTPPLLAITDRTRSVWPLPFLVTHLLEGGCRWISLREKDLTFRERRALLSELLALARPFGALVTVHGDVVAALETGADGVHLSAFSDIALVRETLPPESIIGVSTHSVEEAREAAAAGADYVTLSPIFPTPSKQGYGPALGLAALAQARDSTIPMARNRAIPIVALGGVTAENGWSCLAAGAVAVAVMGPLMAACEPVAFTRRLVDSLAPSEAARP